MSEVKTTFEDQLSVVFFACYASEPFTIRDIQEAVLDIHRSNIYNLLRNFVEQRYLERVSDTHYKATQYAKDILNVKMEQSA